MACKNVLSTVKCFYKSVANRGLKRKHSKNLLVEYWHFGASEVI